MMRKVDIAYSAALFEGEGCVHAAKGRWLVVRITMTDREPVERMHGLWGGRFYGPRQNGKTGRKPIYSWEIAGLDVVLAFHKAVEPWLSPRRLGQFDNAIRAAIKAIPLLPTSPPCGREVKPSTTGSVYHARRGEPPCVNCRESARLFQAERRATGRRH